MKVTVLGTAGAAPYATRLQTGVLIDAPPLRLLIDCGSGIAHRLAQQQAWQGITHVALTHFHADHTIDLITLINAWKYGELPPRKAPLTIMGPAGTAQFCDRLLALYNEPLGELPFHTDVLDLTTASHEIAPGVLLDVCAVPHTASSVAYSVRRGGFRVAFSGDTGYDEAFAQWALTPRCDLLLMECSLPDDLAIPMHLTPRQCGSLARIAQPRLLALTHFYPPVESVDIHAQIAESFAGPVTLCQDGWTWTTEDA
ncbi:MAG: MBL fold metallo-hydrolase [Gemmatimonadaceae bacterium]